MKKSLLIIGIGIVISFIFIFISIWLNCHHGPAGGAETLDIPGWLQNTWSLLAGYVLGSAVQIVALVLSIRTQFHIINSKWNKLVICILWSFGLCTTLLTFRFAGKIIMASWTV